MLFRVIGKNKLIRDLPNFELLKKMEVKDYIYTKNSDHLPYYSSLFRGNVHL